MVHELIEAGLRQHQAGRLMEAKNLYEQALASEPAHPDALHLLGVVALQSGDAGRAEALIEQAIELQPGNPGFHANLAQAYLASQRVADAHAAFVRAAALNPHNPQLTVGAANCLAMQGRTREAEQQLRDVVQRHPDFALAWFNLGNAVRDQGRQQEAADFYQHAVDLEPQFPDARNGLGVALHALERFEEAEQAYRKYLALQPDAPAGYCNLASVLIDVGRFGEAAAACEQGIAQSRATADLHFVLGTAYAHQGNLLSALVAFHNATELDPDHARAACAYGSALHEAGRHEQGLEWLERALELQPGSPEFRYVMAGACLSAGELQAGWKEYESRPARPRALIRYAGAQLDEVLPESLSGKHVCLLPEQGLGDELFFLRFTPALKSRGAAITCRASTKLASLFRRVPLLHQVIGENEPIPAADVTMLVGDLPRALGRPACSAYRGRTFSRRQPPGPAQLRSTGMPRRVSVFFPEIPPALPLAPLPEKLARMRQRLAALGPPPHLGITWRAGTAPEAQRGASWSLHKQVARQMLGAALRDLPGTFLALQRNPKPGELRELAESLGRPVHDLTELNEDLEGMLALLALIDDYIGVSNTNMHLRAGTGRPARVLVPLPVEWRWMAAGDESPWFPGFRIYRQRADGDWSAALDRLTKDLLSAFGASAEVSSER